MVRCAPSRSRQLLLSVVLLSTLGTGTALAQSSATFADVPDEHWASPFVEALVDAGFTTGCAPGLYCPDRPVTRAEIAVFLVRALKGPDFVPAKLPGGAANDVPLDHWAFRWVQHSLNNTPNHLMEPCGVELGLFCPEDPMTRAEITMPLLWTKYNEEGVKLPTLTTARFDDVPFDAFVAPWVELLATDGITEGCTPTRYCPNDPVTRAEMAVFLVRAFNLPIPLGEL